MTDELWILAIMAGTIVILALIAMIMFTPPAPEIPPDGPIRFSVKPFADSEPDPSQLFLGDALAREFTQSLERYARFETPAGDTPARFVVTGRVRKKGTQVTVRAQAEADGRRYWSTSFNVKDEDRTAAIQKAAASLARKMKATLK
jgi:TolB-like protein